VMSDFSGSAQDGPTLGIDAYIDAYSSPLYQVRALVPETHEAVAKALEKDAVARRIISKAIMIEHGEVIGVRLNLSIIKSTGVAVHTVHRGPALDPASSSANGNLNGDQLTDRPGYQRGFGLYRKEVVCYMPLVTLHHAWFNVNQKARQEIASGLVSKSPMASIDGSFVKDQKQPSFNGIEVSFQPKRVHLFVDADNRPIEYAEHVTIMGHRAYVRGHVRYFSEKTAPQKAGNAPSDVAFFSSRDGFSNGFSARHTVSMRQKRTRPFAQLFAQETICNNLKLTP
jgi:hypothetical protein